MASCKKESLYVLLPVQIVSYQLYISSLICTRDGWYEVGKGLRMLAVCIYSWVSALNKVAGSATLPVVLFLFYIH